MPSTASPAAPSSPWRALLWGLALLAIACLAMLGLAARAGDQALFRAGTAGFIASVAGALLAGLRHQRATRAIRDARSRQVLHLMLLTQLARHDEDALARMARTPGPAGDAARDLLRGRRAERRGTP